jgi:hypothetical protein
VECGKPRARTRRCLSWSHQLKCRMQGPCECRDMCPRSRPRLCGHRWKSGVQSGKPRARSRRRLSWSYQLKCVDRCPDKCQEVGPRSCSRPCAHGWERGVESGEPCRKNPRPCTRTGSGTSCNRRNKRRGNSDHSCPCPGREGRAIAVAGTRPGRTCIAECGSKGHYPCSSPGRGGTPNLRRRHYAGTRSGPRRKRCRTNARGQYRIRAKCPCSRTSSRGCALPRQCQSRYVCPGRAGPRMNIRRLPGRSGCEGPSARSYPCACSPRRRNNRRKKCGSQRGSHTGQ